MVTANDRGATAGELRVVQLNWLSDGDRQKMLKELQSVSR